MCALAQGEPSEVSAQDKARAAKIFRSAEGAFRQHEYARAAEQFEEANSIAPHPAALFNAARAWEKAGELRRAANLCGRYLRDAPEDDARRPKANLLIAELIPKLGRIEVVDRGAQHVQIDGQPRDLDVTYVDPGDHSVSGVFGDRIARRKISVVAGSLERVVLERPKAPLALSNAEPAPPAAESEKPATRDERPFQPIHIWIGAGVTAALAGVTIWSGLDTQSAREEYDANPTPEGLDDGRAKQRRTNVLLGTTLVIGAATGVAALSFTEWKERKPGDLALGIGTSSLVLKGWY
jgi:tetratricopeptide (TPR) repeat protein